MRHASNNITGGVARRVSRSLVPIGRAIPDHNQSRSEGWQFKRSAILHCLSSHPFEGIMHYLLPSCRSYAVGPTIEHQLTIESITKSGD